MKALTPTPMICTKIGSITPSVVHVTVDFFGAPEVVGMFLRGAHRGSSVVSDAHRSGWASGSAITPARAVNGRVRATHV